ncbi:MAG TPA: hypothetical protein VG206_12675 [Terriglobia bacterium]|nr:hypothetical protein [Terriglobia bacterium]
MRKERLQQHFPEYPTYTFRVDVTGVINQDRKFDLALVKFRPNLITLKDLGPLVAYSLIARPRLSMLISPRGVSPRLSELLLNFGRREILTYGNGRSIKLAKWDPVLRQIDYSSVVPRGPLF